MYCMWINKNLVHQVGDQTKVILRCTVNQPSRFAILSKQDRYTNTKRSKQQCIKTVRPYGIIKSAGPPDDEQG